MTLQDKQVDSFTVPPSNDPTVITTTVEVAAQEPPPIELPKIATPENMSQYRRTYGRIKSVSADALTAGIRIGLYAPGGVGKTTLAGTIMQSDLGWPCAYLDARGNPEVLSSYGEKLQVFPIANFGDVEDIRQGILRDKKNPFKAVILDNLSEMHAIDLRDRYGAEADITWTMHSAATADVLQLARNWSDMANIYGLHVIFIMWETPETREIRGKEVSRSELAFNKALQAQLPGIISWLGRLYITDDSHPYTRCLDFRPIERLHQAKFQIDPNDPYAKMIPMEIYNPSLASIVDTIKGHKPWPTEKHQEPVSRFSKKPKE